MLTDNHSETKHITGTKSKPENSIYADIIIN